MARSTRKTTAARRSATSTTSTPPTTGEKVPVTPEEDKGVESPAPDPESAAEADPEPPAGTSDDDDTTKDEENAPQSGDEHDGPDDEQDEQEDAKEDEPESAKEDESLNVASDEWRTDGNGNSLRAAVPARPTHTGSLFPFEYTEGELKNTIVTSERVYAQMEFYGTKRKGKAFAYPAGVVLPKSVLDSVVRDA